MSSAANAASIAAVLTETTCSVACWMAREEVCRCSCGGRNHGCLKTGTGEQPIRECKIDGVRYQLKAVGLWREIYQQGQAINRAAPKRRIGANYECHWYMSDKGAPARMKLASTSQFEKWAELAAYREAGAIKRPYLLWERVTPIQDQTATSVATPAPAPKLVNVPTGACFTL
jgi:hypothetical protein